MNESVIHTNASFDITSLGTNTFKFKDRNNPDTFYTIHFNADDGSLDIYSKVGTLLTSQPMEDNKMRLKQWSPK
jgi:hypothetical protein